MNQALLHFVRTYGTLACFGLILLFFWVMLPGTFMTGRNLFNITQQVSMLAVTAFAMTIVMTMGDYDLSVGSMASLAGIVLAVVFRLTDAPLIAMLAALVVGVVGGAFNGFLVSFLGILPFVATLGTLTIFSGLAFLISGGKTIFGSGIPASLGEFARGGLPLWTQGDTALVLPNLTLVAAATLLVVWFILQKTVFGRHLHAMGGSSEAARLAGIDVRMTRLAAFALSGLAAAIAGLMYTARVASANPVQGSGLMLDAIAAVFLGMTMNVNGEPKVLNTLAGVLFLGVLSNGLTQLSVDSYIRDILVGSIIILAVAASGLEKLRRN
ncbi:ABC transporter permease [Aestuariivirga sp.]|uniref:ABC transporter permease n=1 Tax=Aestuariivirga sp. TaxID=2650926 RepID=UPI0039E6ADA4